MIEVVLLTLAFRYLAQGAPLPVNPNVFEQYGPIGLVCGFFAAISWTLFRRYEKALDLERAEKREAQAEVRELNKITRELVMPALTQATSAITEVMRVLRKDAPP